MITNTYDTLESFAENHDVDVDSLGHETAEEAAMLLEKADSFASRGVEGRADTLRAEAAALVGIDQDAGEDDDAQTATLSQAEVVDALSEFDLDTLGSIHEIERTIETVEKKLGVFERRGCPKRAGELQVQRDCLEAAKEAVEQRGVGYDSVDTLANHCTREGLILTRDETDTLTSRQAGGGVEVELVETNSREYDMDNLQACGLMAYAGAGGSEPR